MKHIQCENGIYASFEDNGLRGFVWVFTSVQEVDGAAIIPHIAESSGQKFPYEVLFRSLHKLLMDTATSE